MGWSDGGSRGHENTSSSALVLKIWVGGEGPSILAASSIFRRQAAKSSFEVEAMAMHSLWHAIMEFLNDAAPSQGVEVRSMDHAERFSNRRRCTPLGPLTSKCVFSMTVPISGVSFGLLATVALQIEAKQHRFLRGKNKVQDA